MSRSGNNLTLVLWFLCRWVETEANRQTDLEVVQKFAGPVMVGSRPQIRRMESDDNTEHFVRSLMEFVGVSV